MARCFDTPKKFRNLLALDIKREIIVGYVCTSDRALKEAAEAIRLEVLMVCAPNL